ncbi:MAG: response regulator [Lachnospiraceae bacterium]|jgi:CheY-like chemotaxis protein|nr:response regulator [Lachnospiraceae bacterium]
MGNDTTTEEKENKLKRRGLRVLLIVLLICCIVSVAVVYLRYTSKSIILVPLLMLCIAVLLLVLLLHPAVSVLSANKLPVPEKREKKKKRKGRNAVHDYAFHKPGHVRKDSSIDGLYNLNIGLADKAGKDEEGFSEELLKSIDTNFVGKRALLVEDNDINRDIANLVLTKLGFEVEIAEDGKQGVEMVKTSEPGYYDVVLMDIQMPVMDGYEAARRIRKIKDKRNAQVPIVALTVCVTNEDIKASNDAGMDGHIAKPIDISKMKKVLEKALKKAYNF